MYLKIKNINVINANLFSSPYTAGLSLAAMKGLVDNLSMKVSEELNKYVYFNGFGLIVTEIESKIDEQIQRDTSTGSTSKNKYELPALLQNRYFNFTIDLVLQLSDEISEEAGLLSIVAQEINKCKIQGGMITNFINIENMSQFSHLESEELVYRTYPLGYFIIDATSEIDENKDFIEQITNKLLDKNYMLISNGYKVLQESDYVRQIEKEENLKSLYVESNLMLAKILPIHEFNKEKTKLKNFMFSNFKKEGYLIVHAL